MTAQITIKELLKDEQYKKYFLTVPQLPSHYEGTKPWKLYVKLKGETNWKAKRYETYKEAVEAYKRLLPKIEDAAINCPALAFRPPIRNVRLKGKFKTVRGQRVPEFRSLIWHPKLDADHEKHTWCSYCRRPTVFKVLAARIKSLNNKVILSDPKLRCTICNASEDLVNTKHPEREQAWDTNRPTMYEIYRGK